MEAIFGFFSDLFGKIAGVLRVPLESFAKSFTEGGLDGFFSNWKIYIIPVIIIGIIIDIIFNVQKFRPLNRRKANPDEDEDYLPDDADGFEDFNDVSIYETPPADEPTAGEIASLMESSAMTPGYQAESLYTDGSLAAAIAGSGAANQEGALPPGQEPPDAKVYRMNRSAATDPWYREEEPDLEDYKDNSEEK